MSIAASHRRGAAGPRRSAQPGALGVRARVFLRRGTLDRLLAAGGDPRWHPELALRATQVTARAKRHALAESLERAVLDAHRPPRWTCAAPLDRGAVRGAARELRALAACVATTAAPAAQGVVLAGQLLRDPCSPLYAPGDEEALREGARIARQTLGHDTQTGEEKS
jgi:hypothetical protein